MADGPIRAAFGKRLARLRIARDLTQRDLARDLRIDVAVVSRLERGVTDPKLSMIEALARLLGVRVVDLLSDGPPATIEGEIAQLREKIDETDAIAREALRLAKARKK